MLERCQYAQWVPQADVVVGQTDGSLVIWYNIEEISAKRVLEMEGQVEGIVRDNHKTEVIMNTPSGRTTVTLDEALIDFSSKQPTKAFNLFEDLDSDLLVQLSCFIL